MLKEIAVDSHYVLINTTRGSIGARTPPNLDFDHAILAVVLPPEFPGPEHDTDVIEITLPADYVVEELPPPVDVDDGFASYQSKTEVVGHVLRYSRRFEIKELTVPVAKADQLREFFRIIAGDERNSAVLKHAAP